MNFEAILYEKKNKIATITMNRPDKLNSMNTKMAEELLQVFEMVDQDDEVRVVIITGAGRGFSAGADFQERFMPRLENRKKGIVQDVTREYPELGCKAMTRIRKPVIAAVNGVALGIGCGFAVAADVRIASENAKFSLPFGRIGLISEFGLSYLLPRLVGMGKACEMFFTARMVEAQEAKEIGLVNTVVPQDKLMDATRQMAESMTKLAPLTLKLAKRLLYQGLSAGSLESHLPSESLAINLAWRTEDVEEGARAFLEKREPIFKDR